MHDTERGAAMDRTREPRASVAQDNQRFDVEFLEPGAARTRPALPTRVQPNPNEALCSWLLRYAAPFGVSPERLLLDRADMHLVDGPDWWRSPAAGVLSRLADRSGIDRTRLAAMTFLDWCATDDSADAAERFANGRYQFARPRPRTLNRIGVCPTCLANDETAYVRRDWSIGWTAVCHQHGLALVHECPECHYKLRMPRLNSEEFFAPERCRRCGYRLSKAPHQEAHQDAVRLQELLLAARPQGIVELPGVGPLSWPLAMALFDILLGLVWNGPKIWFREQLFRRIRRDLGVARELDGSHYAGFLILVWMLDNWPLHVRAAFATLRVPRPRRQLERWTKLGPETRQTIERVLVPVWPDETHDDDRGWWRAWIDTLPIGEQLREMARKDRFICRRIRLLTLADVRDGMPVEVAARVAGVTAKTLYRWICRGAEDGLQAALERPSGKLSQLQALEIAEWIAAAPLDEPRWRRNRVQHEVRSRFGVEISDDAAGRLLRAHGPWRRPTYIPIRRPALAQLPIED
jgi:transposase